MAVCGYQAATRAFITWLEQDQAAAGQLHALRFFGFGLWFGFVFGLWFGFVFGLWFFGLWFFGFVLGLWFGFVFGLWFFELGLLNQRDARIRIR